MNRTHPKRLQSLPIMPPIIPPRYDSLILLYVPLQIFEVSPVAQRVHKPKTRWIIHNPD